MLKLAYLGQMNGTPLPEKHRYPFAVIVPGVLGACSVKWVDMITAADKESPRYCQRHDFKIRPPGAVDSESANKDWDKTQAMLEMVRSFIARVGSHSLAAAPKDRLCTVANYSQQPRCNPLPLGWDMC
jgi:sulfite oxidase